MKSEIFRCSAMRCARRPLARRRLLSQRVFGNQSKHPKRPVLDGVVNRLRPRLASQQLHLVESDRMPSRRQLP